MRRGAWVKSFVGVVGFVVIVLVGVSYQPDTTAEELRAMYGQAPSRFVEINGMQVHYRTEGRASSLDKIPLVVLHGTGASLHTWDGWVRELKKDIEIIRLDLPAYGLTGPNPHHDYSIEAYVRFLHQFLNKIGVKECYLAGNSLGGAIAWQFALAYPSQVKKLILIDAAGYPQQSKSVPLAFRIGRTPVLKQLINYLTPRAIAESSLKNVYYDDTKVTEELIDRYWKLTLRAGNREAFVRRLNAPTTQNEAWQNIRKLSMPVLIQWGKHDELIPLEVAERFRNDLPNDTLIVYSNAGHVPMEEIPERTAKDAREFLLNNR